MILHSNVIPCQVANHELTTMTLNMRKSKRPSAIKKYPELTNYDPQSPSQQIITKKNSYLEKCKQMM